MTTTTTIKSTEPWKRGDILHTPNIPGFTVKWCSPTQFQKRLSEGWEFVERPKDTSAKLPSIEGSQMDPRVRTRELVLMKLPLERKKVRDEFYKQRSRELLDSSIQTFEEASNKLVGISKSPKGTVYGSYNVKKEVEE